MDRQSWNSSHASTVKTTNTNIAYIDLTSDDSSDVDVCTSAGPVSTSASSLPVNQDVDLSANHHASQNLNVIPRRSQTGTLSRKRKAADQGESSSGRNANVNTALRIGGPLNLEDVDLRSAQGSNRNRRMRMNPSNQQPGPANSPLASNQNPSIQFEPMNLPMNNASRLNPPTIRAVPRASHTYMAPANVNVSSPSMMHSFLQVPQHVSSLQLGSGQNANVPAPPPPLPHTSASLTATYREMRLQRVANVLSGLRESFVQRPESGTGQEFLTTASRRILAEHFGSATAARGRHMNLEDLLLPTHVMLQRRSAFLHDRHRDMRLDVDNMSYEELLALEERIGNVNIGIDEKKIMKCLKQRKYMSLSEEKSSEEEPCCICQEAYVVDEDVGRLNCGHDFHTACIKKWLIMKNMCPVCKTDVPS